MKNKMINKDEGNYKGFNFKLEYCGFKIGNKNGSKIPSFEAYAGNKLLDEDEKTQRKKLLSMIRYRINKYLKKIQKRKDE
jgi:hypothetical protein